MYAIPSLRKKRTTMNDIACGIKAVRLDMPGEESRAKIGTIMDEVWATLSFGVVVPTPSQRESLLPRVASEAARSPRPFTS
jgi:hypothetical protein